MRMSFDLPDCMQFPLKEVQWSKKETSRLKTGPEYPQNDIHSRLNAAKKICPTPIKIILPVSGRKVSFIEHCISGH